MTAANRAKQFAPFAAITGLDQAIDGKQAELDWCERRVFSEERSAELDDRLHGLRKGMRVSLGYYAGNTYRSISGLIDRIEPTEELLIIGREHIRFADISDIFNEQALPFSPEYAILSPGDAE